ncbi:MAG: tripartite tricarboxylate transporter substrate binding protein, partial [Achromobacter sp.]|nr:tripartite tricarboxylate transporter substrate binding protein [Achromobacter sp.]
MHKTTNSDAPAFLARKSPLKALAILGLAAVLGSANVASAQGAQGYPGKPVTINVPFSAGGTTDILARVIGQRLSERWGVSVVVENKPGAGGNIGTAQVARAAPDGYTLVMGFDGPISVARLINSAVKYDAETDL